MLASLTKTFNFEAAHFLTEVPENHKCRRIHGHSFQCEIEITGDVGKNSGWVMDYADIKKIIDPVRDQLDHRFLNQDIPELKNPTSENLCRWIWGKLQPELPFLSAITIAETCTSKCTYKGK